MSTRIFLSRYIRTRLGLARLRQSTAVDGQKELVLDPKEVLVCVLDLTEVKERHLVLFVIRKCEKDRRVNTYISFVGFFDCRFCELDSNGTHDTGIASPNDSPKCRTGQVYMR